MSPLPSSSRPASLSSAPFLIMAGVLTCVLCFTSTDVLPQSVAIPDGPTSLATSGHLLQVSTRDDEIRAERLRNDSVRDQRVRDQQVRDQQVRNERIREQQLHAARNKN